ncbi:MAG: ComEC/Rec2 family competence protein [Sulfurospirillaceae bacterium]|nr:ComEC/Rec2 family competence protein [Sulfurospirillaceae bacterium]MDD2827591.1 ComEC/Rec2 family competence protein [Sulfurospirillaceae bacterium]
MSSSSLVYDYMQYRSFIQEPLHESEAIVVNHYQKSNAKGKVYDVFKLKLPNTTTFYTVSWKPLKVGVNEKVKVKFSVENLTFLEYLKGFYATSFYIYALYQDDLPIALKLSSWIAEQHSDSDISSLFQALFLATPLSKELREDVQKWGISHLVAISGFHLGVLSFILYAFFNPFYRFFQDRYFPYRNKMADVSVLVFIFLYMYMELIGFTPSFMRAFVMSVLGFLLFSHGVKIVSFSNLLLTSVSLLALFPSLMFSLSFWFSVAGVFYLFLLMHHFAHLNSWALVGVIDGGVFLLMIPIVHTFFPVFTFLQLTSPISSLVFIVFYPLEMLLHVMHLGGILDKALLAFLHVKIQSFTLSFPVWFLAGYIGLSLLAIRFRSVLFVCLALCLASLFFIT